LAWPTDWPPALDAASQALAAISFALCRPASG
jgi:hypothetical protein